LPDFLRRGTVHVIVVALIVAALAPQAVAATPSTTATTERLLAAVESSPATEFAVRGTTTQRSRPAFDAAATLPALAGGTEQIHPAGVARPPAVSMQATLVGVPAPTVSRPGGPATITGTATWYCCTMNWGNAAVVALPVALGGHYYPPPGGGFVTVCADRCARLPIGDACGCHWGRAGQKVVDLSPAAWAAVTDKDRYVYGVVTVTLYLD
jgi:hypothetical protein